MSLRTRLATPLTVGLLAVACASPSAPPPMSRDRIDLATHTRRFDAAAHADGGEADAIEYARQYFTTLGLQQVTVQSVPLVRMTTTSSALRLNTPRGPFVIDPQGTQYVIWPGHQQATASFSEARIVFAGYGIVAPDFQRDDYKDVDVRGQMVLLIEGPPVVDGREELGAAGRAYYGRRFYKFAEAARHGAAGVVLIHQAQEPWDMVREEFGNGIVEIATEANALKQPAPIIEGMMTPVAATTLFSAVGLDLTILTRNAAELAFRPVQIPVITMDAELTSTVTTETARSAFGVLRGALDQHIVLTSRWNPVPMASLRGSAGATREGATAPPALMESLEENAGSGASVVLETAAVLATARTKPRGSFVFGITTATADGIPGLTYYMDHPLLPTTSTVGHLFLDAGSRAGSEPPRVGQIGFSADGALSQLTRDEATLKGRVLVPDQDPARSFYYRANQWDLSSRSIPSLFVTFAPDNDRKLRPRPLIGDDGQATRQRPEDDVWLLADLLARAASITAWRPQPPPPTHD